jgi:uncharacterized protein (DUF2267 family)
LQQVLPSNEGVYVERIIRVGTPASEILDVAAEWNVDLIVLGSHGRVGLSRLLMGSIAEEVIRRATCPVVALTPAADARTEVNGKEDWISTAMREAQPLSRLAERDRRAERMVCLANASFSATVEHTVRTSNRWLRDVRVSLGQANQSQAFRILRAVLHALRDHLGVRQVASLGAQLPLLFRGIWYEGWNPSDKPVKRRRKADFVADVISQLNGEPLDDAEGAIRAVLGALSKHLTAGEVASIEGALSHELRELWPTPAVASQSSR